MLPQFGRSGRKANIQGRVRGVQFEATVCHTHRGKSIEAEGHVVLKGVILGFSRGCEHVRTDRAPFGRAIRKQRVWITMTVVEETQLVLPDEPTLALDLGR